MDFDLVTVDGSNYFSSCARVAMKLDFPRHVVKAYFKEWFNVPSCLRWSLPNFETFNSLGVVIFHSKRSVGPSSVSISSGDEAVDFWLRQGAEGGVSTVLVDYDKAGQVLTTFECRNCNEMNEVGEKVEKGLDTSMAVFLIETVDNFSNLCIAADDTDYVPVVEALRRKGKVVAVTGARQRKPSILQSRAQHFFPISPTFFSREIGTYNLFRKGGFLDTHFAGLEWKARIASSAYISVTPSGDETQRKIHEFIEQDRANDPELKRHLEDAHVGKGFYANSSNYVIDDRARRMLSERGMLS